MNSNLNSYLNEIIKQIDEDNKRVRSDEEMYNAIVSNLKFLEKRCSNIK